MGLGFNLAAPGDGEDFFGDGDREARGMAASAERSRRDASRLPRGATWRV